MRRESEFGLLAPLVALALGAIAVFVGSLFVWAGQVDRDVRGREEALVRRGVLASIVEIERSILPETNWDEAVVNLDNRFDPVWADNNLNDYFAQNIDFEQLFVLDGNNRAIYGRHHKDTVAAADFAHFVGAAPLIEAVRRAEAKRGPFTKLALGQRKTLVSTSIQASDFLVLHDKVYLVSATLVQPDFATAIPKGPRAPIVVMALRLDPMSMGQLKDRFQLTGLRAHVGPETVKPGAAHVSLDTSPGGPPLVLSWTPQRPGAELARAAVLPIALLILTFGGVGAVMIVRIRRAAAHLVASHRAQSEFLANMSHEIRTPLNGVTAIAAALERTTLNPAQSEMVGIIKGSGTTLERLLSDVLDLSRIETGTVAVVNEPFHLADAVRAVAAIITPRAQEKGLDLRVEIDPVAEAVVMGDVVRIKQILTNLISNAVKFTARGHVAITAFQEADGRWRIDVEDTGVGFDPADKARLFERFAQADGSVTRQFGGTGMGLTISRQLLDLMGGELDAVGAPGRGAIFTVRLPLEATAAAAAETAADRTSDHGPERALRVLLADDHPTNRRVVQVLLADFDVDLVCTENGLEACEAFQSQAFDLVLMDMQMPVMDGLTAIRTIRQFERERGLSQTAIVMLTANALPEHKAASLAAGADQHMPKPIEVGRLFSILHDVGERQKIRAAA